MGLILDTCIFIRAEKSSTANMLEAWQTDEEIFISAMTVSELLVGVQSADNEARRLKRSAFVEAIIAAVPVLNFEPKSARTHAEIYAYLAKRGELIGAHDLIIAATALSHGHSVLTTNHREFSRIPGLVVKTLPA